MKIIECSGLTKIYGSIRALNDMAFDIEENTITALIGRNGAGKTTLLKTIAGFIPQTGGEIKVFSEKPFNSIKVAANTIFVDHQLAFPASLTIDDILASAGSFYEKFDQALAEGLLDYFGINPLQYPDKLSQGMRSTFLGVLGIAARCSLTLMDEPTIGMDASVRQDFYRALLKDYMAHPRTVIISSHHLNEIEDLMEDILLIKEGKELLHLPITELTEFALGFRGKSDQVRANTLGKEVFHQESLGKDGWYAVVRNDYLEEELNSAKMSGIEILPVSAEDLSVYLTAKSKGGIDDVFNRN